MRGQGSVAMDQSSRTYPAHDLVHPAWSPPLFEHQIWTNSGGLVTTFTTDQQTIIDTNELVHSSTSILQPHTLR
jgi:hypothetical protein